MNKVYLYKNISKYDNEVAHIYEHIFIDTFEQFAQENSFTPGFFGYLGGRTYDTIMIIEGGFYNMKAQKLLYDFTRRPIKVADEDVQKNLAVISSELNSNIEIINRDKLITEIDEISELPFRDMEDQYELERFPIRKNQTKSKCLKLTKNKKGFKKLEVSFAYKGTNLEDIAIVYRIWPILVNNIALVTRKLGGYDGESFAPWFDENKKWLRMYIEVNLKRGDATKNHLFASVKEMQKKIIFFKLKKELSIYTNSFENSEALAHIPEDIFTSSGLLVSRSKIAELFTPENVQRVWDKLDLNIN